MSCIYFIRALAAVAIVTLLVSLASVPGAVASEGAHVTAATDAAVATPDVTVIMKSTGDRIGKADVYMDGMLAGTTDSKGNLTFKETPTAGNHTITVTKKGLLNETATADFSEKPVVVGMTLVKGVKVLTPHGTEKTTTHALANKAVFCGSYELGTTDATGNLVIDNFPQGIHLRKFSADGYKPATTFMLVFSNKTQNIALTPAEATTPKEH
jgi:hypothetical protein